MTMQAPVTAAPATASSTLPSRHAVKHPATNHAAAQSAVAQPSTANPATATARTKPADNTNAEPTNQPATLATNFDSQLEQARQQQRISSPSLPVAPVALPASPLMTGDAAVTEKDAPTTDGDAATLAAAMLAMLGQAPHALPLKTDMQSGAAAPQTAAGLAANAANAIATAPMTTAVASSLIPAFDDTQPVHAHKDAAVTDTPAMTTSIAMDAGQTNTPVVHALRVEAPVTSPTFAQELGQQVAWLGGQDIKQARIRLHPEELGQLDVKISVEHGRVDVNFTAQHPAAVTAVQQSLTQLDSMLAGQGLSLGQAQVGQQGQGHAGYEGGGAEVDGGSGEPEVLVRRVVIGLVDAFA
ncbi:flagellar hook-length control protein FliK [Dyella tabacisoli]|uniref:Flagellar hook-length control protein FliK n=1 Tax=Dyella tabacisoli TaxID=2282381 RepID=A0A369UGZ1_9GAMM|nr:flagellar hook-length control protein FliK [Dyella tabacisoli]RDD79747.1 flagellar hook-length control protein FliK [Dyella tabacisoli]